MQCSVVMAAQEHSSAVKTFLCMHFCSPDHKYMLPAVRMCIYEIYQTLVRKASMLQADGLHLTCKAQVWLGRQLANTFMEKGLKS